MSPLLFALVAAASGLGAVARFFLTHLVARRFRAAFPWGTLLVNTSGSLALGILTGLATLVPLDPHLHAAIAFGFLGSFTTFSTWMTDTAHLATTRHPLAAAANLLLPTLTGLAAAYAGLQLGLTLTTQLQ